MIKKLLSLYYYGYERILCYMLQASEYEIADFWHWWRSVGNFTKVSSRGSLVPTMFGKLLYWFVGLWSLLLLAVCAALALISITQSNILALIGAILLLVLRPFLVTAAAVVLVLVGKKAYIEPNLRRSIAQATEIFANHPGIKIAVLGSYGKTTMKELLNTVLSEGLTVAATPATKNVAVSHAAFARKLTGMEQVVIVEFGEGKPGDTKLFTDMLQPQYAVVTGLAPSHLDHYGTLTAVAEDFAYIATKLDQSKIYVNGADEALMTYFPEALHYTAKGVGAWHVKQVQISEHGLDFTLQAKAKHIAVSTQLLGEHQIGPLSAVAAIAAELGMETTVIEAGIHKTVPYEHRMQPRRMGGALLIDDTYNGNIEGIKAGIALLRALPAERRIYVTPGLVEQGAESDAIHQQIGTLLADAGFDEIVLMKNKYTQHIQAGLAKRGYTGLVTLEADPLNWYKNIEYHVAAGDVIMMQNDLPDRYL